MRSTLSPDERQAGLDLLDCECLLLPGMVLRLGDCPLHPDGDREPRDLTADMLAREELAPRCSNCRASGAVVVLFDDCGDWICETCR